MQVRLAQSNQCIMFKAQKPWHIRQFQANLSSGFPRTGGIAAFARDLPQVRLPVHIKSEASNNCKNTARGSHGLVRTFGAFLQADCFEQTATRD